MIDKPVGPTSHDVVARVRRALGQRRTGHGGTLDPPASGLLLVALGRPTRLLRYVLDLEKSYDGELVLGSATTTLDDTGEVTARAEMSGISATEVATAASSFVGAINQVPPMVSAVKIGGRRLHELAREGLEVDRPPRPVTIHRLEVAPTDEPLVFRLDVTCSSGTYIRSLAADIGAALGGVAHLRSLRRSAIGGFTLADAVPLEGLEASMLRPAAAIVGHLRSVEVDPALRGEIATGKVLERRSLGVSGEGPWALLDEGGVLLAVYEDYSEERAKPAVVLVEPGPRAGAAAAATTN